MVSEPRPQSEDQIAREAADNGAWPAHPTQALDGSGMPRSEHCPGLTKRELFAAMAMQGVCGSEVYMDMTPAALAKEAVLIADTLLKELAK